HCVTAGPEFYPSRRQATTTRKRVIALISQRRPRGRAQMLEMKINPRLGGVGREHEAGGRSRRATGVVAAVRRALGADRDAQCASARLPVQQLEQYGHLSRALDPQS